MTPPSVAIDGSALGAAQVADVARRAAPVSITPEGERRMVAAREALDGVMSDGEAHYGINTGFGSLSRQRIDDADLRDLQRNLVRSHAAGVGESLPEDVVRGMMLLLVASLSRGHSAIRVESARLIAGLLNEGITPVVPGIGSVGASGDLAPLAHVALVLIGEGEATLKGETLPGGEALKRAGLSPVTLEAKEGLALINGTHLMAARLALLWEDLDHLFDAAMAATAMSIDACRGTDSFLDPRVYAVRNQAGATRAADRIRGLLDGSEILPSHAENDPRVQDPYSIRCAPMVLGAAWDALRYARERLDDELGAVTDNPLVFGGDDPVAISAGAFHGMPMAIPLDTCGIAISHIAGISERRVYHMLSAFDEESHLPPYLSPKPGLHSGLMIAQYTSAALCNEIITLATPASVSNISTSAGMEDYNSFGPTAARQADRAMRLCRQVVAIELLCAAQGIESHRPLKSGEGVERAHAMVRSVVPVLTEDRPPAPDIEVIAELIADGSFTWA